MRSNQLKRREFITLVCGAAAAAAPLVVLAQQVERVRRIGVLMSPTGKDVQGRAGAMPKFIGAV